MNEKMLFLSNTSSYRAYMLLICADWGKIFAYFALKTNAEIV